MWDMIFVGEKGLCENVNDKKKLKRKKKRELTEIMSIEVRTKRNSADKIKYRRKKVQTVGHFVEIEKKF